MMRTLVINLARSGNRRRAIKSRLDAVGLPFEFQDGIDGQLLTPQQLALYSSRDAFATIGRELHRNEIGCILSHIGIWSNLVQSGDDEVLVIEDDMLVEPDFPALVTDRGWIPADARIVNFGWDMAEPVEIVPITKRRSLCRFDREVMRTGTYFMRRSAAELLLTKAFPIRMPADSLIGDERNVGGPIYGVTPRPVEWDEALPSDMWTDATMDNFAVASRNSLRGLALRLLNKVRSQRTS
jgi:glycosyl transferase family 25